MTRPASLFPLDVLDLARAVLAACAARGWRVATAESCTGGLVAAALSEIAGASTVVDRGLVTYSNAAKTALLDVPPALIEQHGAVSQPVAEAMARGALAALDAELSISITGVAGPGGGSAEKPVGLVWFATAVRDSAVTPHVERFGDLGRSAVRLAALRTALALLNERAR